MRGFFRDVEEIAARMEGVIADLLLLARCQAGVEVTRLTTTRLSEEVSAAWQRRGTDRPLQVDLDEDPVVITDPGKLAIVLDNLLGNADQYAAPGAAIRCVGRRNGKTYDLKIENRAHEPLAEADLAHLVEPFWRQDSARSSGIHAGLGLSVVAALAALLRIDLRFDQERNGVFRVVLGGLSIS